MQRMVVDNSNNENDDNEILLDKRALWRNYLHKFFLAK